MRRQNTIALASIAGATLLAASSPGLAADAPRDLVRVHTGQLKGSVDGDVVAFKGVPFAAPPVGDLRWRPPQPAAAWSGVRAADQFGAICQQPADTRDNGVGRGPISEDCLTLNVWAPTQRSAGPLPVMVWIYGGGYVAGSSSAPLYDGAHLARQGVVLVTLNYRLGRLGFFAHPALTREARGELVANYALMDQIAALKWVQRNIRAFGGDSKNVTIFGESAGGAAVNHLMISPMTRGLFHRAISQSGIGRERSSRLQSVNAQGVPSAEAQGRAFMESLGVKTDSAAALRAVPAERIIAAGAPNPLVDGGPIIDGKLQTMDVDEAFEKGREANIPYLVGYNSLEIPFQAPMFEDVRTRATEAQPDKMARVKAAYGDEAAFELRAVSDLVFSEPARYLAARHAQNGHPTYLYRFSFQSASIRERFKGAPHASERQYVFGNLNASNWPSGEEDKPVAAAMSAYWSTFARRGDPNGGVRPAWPAYSQAKDQLLEFTAGGPVASAAPFSAALDAIATLYRKD